MTISENPANPSDVLTKAAVRAASALGFTNTQLARIVDIEEVSLNAPIDPASETGLRARQIIQIYQHLHALTGNDSKAITHWMQTKSRRLGSSPIDRMQTSDGLDRTLSYLESLKQ